MQDKSHREKPHEQDHQVSDEFWPGNRSHHPVSGFPSLQSAAQCEHCTWWHFSSEKPELSGISHSHSPVRALRKMPSTKTIWEGCQHHRSLYRVPPGQGTLSWASPGGTGQSSWLSWHCLKRNFSLLFSHARILRVWAKPICLVSWQGLSDMNENSSAINIYPGVSKERDRMVTLVQSDPSVLKVVRKQARSFHGLSANRNVSFVAMVK